MDLVVGNTVETLLQSAFHNFNDLFTYVRGSRVLEEVRRWGPMLKTIFAEELEDAKEWQMRYLIDLAYDVEDINDKLIIHAKLRKLRAGKLLNSGLSLTKSVKFSSEMVSEVKAFSKRLEFWRASIEERKIRKILRNTGCLPRSSKRIRPFREASPLVKTEVYGREDDYKAILDMMKTEAGDGGTSVIAIVGMGGVGKTTLAGMIYNDESLQFNFKAWASIGEDFDIISVTSSLVEQLEGDLLSLQLKLREILFGKKFLVVLDDLWSDDYDKWTCFYNPFAYGAPGSRIIITTRSNKVSLATSSRDGYVLQRLSLDDSLTLFAHCAFPEEDFTNHMDLMEIGQEIIKRCDGLPLAIKALGAELPGITCCNVWKELLENKLYIVKRYILPVLRLSYENLSPRLKRCFVYCAIFPKEYEFVRDDLVLLWLGEGFVSDLRQAYDCFDELFTRSLFQKSAKGTSVFFMHGLIHDLAKSINKRVCLNLDEERSSEKSYAKVRHLAFNHSKLDGASIFENFQHTECLRTILALPVVEEWRDWEAYSISSKVLNVWIPKLKFLRVLSLSGYKGVELPKSINVLQHLRYLNMGCAKIITLPESLCKLFNLQVLILRNCKNLCKLPGDFCNLINLQCLDLSGTDSLEEMPFNISNLPKLQVVTKFVVGSTDGLGIQELLKLRNLRGKVHVTELQNVVNMEVLDDSMMKEKGKIFELVLEWTDNFDVSRDVENEKQVFDALQPPKNVTRMSIKSYGGTEFPSWFGVDSFKMTVVEIYNCCNVSSLPPLGGLPSLKELSIEGMAGVKEVGLEFYGVMSSSSCSNVFPSLEILNFTDMENWKVWSCFNNVEYEGQFFPTLKKLGIRRCPELTEDFPKSLDSLEELVIEGCKEAILKCIPNLESLTKLEISGILGLESFWVAFPETFKSLQELQVNKCDELQHLWENGTEIEKLGFLKELKISECAELVSFVDGEEGIFPPNLQLLNIYNCDNLERLPHQLQNLTSLTTLWIDRCPKLATFGDLPDNVKKVNIIGCDSLERLPKGIMIDQKWNSHGIEEFLKHDSLIIPSNEIEELELRNLKPDSLIIPSNEVFPSSLKSLSISEGLETQLLGALQLQNHLSRLTTLDLEGSFESFPATGLPIPTLLYLKIGPCRNLRSLPCNMHDLLDLKTLHLFLCPKVESFPERGMPPNLSKLSICYCVSLETQQLPEWRLNLLSCLENLIIAGTMKMIESFPHESLPLPTSLITLCINGFQNLKSISGQLETLTSLQQLYIECCPKLQYLPKKGLPISLECLHIAYCPLLEKQSKAGYVNTRMDLSKIVGGRNSLANVERLARSLSKTSLIEPKVSGREDDHKAILDMMNSEEQIIDYLAEINPLGVGPSFREQHSGRRRPASEECIAFLLLGKAPSIQLVHFIGKEPTAASNRFGSYGELFGACPSLDHVRDYPVRRSPSLGFLVGGDSSMDRVRGDFFRRYPSLGNLFGRDPSMNRVRDDFSRCSPGNSSRYNNLTESYQSTTSDEDEDGASTSQR